MQRFEIRRLLFKAEKLVRAVIGDLLRISKPFDGEYFTKNVNDVLRKMNGIENVIVSANAISMFDFQASVGVSVTGEKDIIWIELNAHRTQEYIDFYKSWLK